MKRTTISQWILQCFLFILLLNSDGLQAQSGEQSLFNDSIHLTVKHRKYEKTDKIRNQQFTDEYLQAFSQSLPRILAYTTFSLHWKQEITQQKDRLKTSLSGIHVRGYKKYRKFPVEELLLPTDIKYTIKLHYKKKDTLVFFDTLSSDSENTSYKSLPDSLNPGNSSFINLDYQLIYYKKQLEKFQQKTQAIDQYYLDYPELKETLEVVGSISLGNLNMLPIQNARLKEAETTLERIRESDYIRILNLEENDPLGFLPRFKNLKSGIEFKREKADRQMKNMDRLLYQEGNNYLSSDTAIARGYFEKTIRTNPYFAPAYLALARLDLRQNHLSTAADRIEHILNHLKPDTTTYKKVMTFNDSLVANFIRRGKTLIEQEDFNEATKVMERAENFCQNTPRYECDSRVDKFLSQARYGIYNAYVSVARQALYKQRPEMAMEYIKMMEKFQRENSSSIVSDKVIKELYDETAKLLINQASYLRESQQYEKANRLLKKAGKLCKTEKCRKDIHQQKAGIHQGIYREKLADAKEYYQNENFEKADKKLKEAKRYNKKYPSLVSALPINDTLRRDVDHELYQKHLQKGAAFLGYEQPGKALPQFTRARCLLNQYEFAVNDTLDSLIRIAARPVVQSQIDRGKLKTWGSRIKQAKKILKKAKSSISNYKLEEDSMIQASLDTFARKLKQKICETAQDTFNRHIKLGTKHIKASNYLFARNNFIKALAIAKKHSGCKIDSLKVKNLLSDHQPMFRFAKRKKKLDPIYQKGNYKKLLTELHSLKDFSGQHDIQAKVPTPIDFAHQYRDEDYLLFIVDHFLAEKKPEKALKVLKLLREKDYPEDKLKNRQKQCGAMLARQDIDKESQKSYKEKAQEYTGNTPWFNTLKRSYKSTWRKAKGIFPYFF